MPEIIASSTLNSNEYPENVMNHRSTPNTPNTNAPTAAFPEYSGVNAFTNANANANAKPASSFVMGSPNLPVFIRVQKDPEPRFMRILHILQMVTGILFVLFIIGVIASQAGAASPLNQAVGSHHQIVISSPVRFEHVQGCDEVKAQLVQVVDFLKNPRKFERFGASMPRGYLLEGPPGVGKTMLAKAVAGEAGVPFLIISGAEFEEVYVGVGASRVRSLFKDARGFKNALIFIDEIDAVANRRSNSDHSTTRQTLNQLLVEMDGFKSAGTNIIVLGATNSVQTLDKALLRPGRFDKTLTLSPPDIAGRKKILASLLAAIPQKVLGKDVKIDLLASTTIGYTGADLANLINQAKLIAATDTSLSDAEFIITSKHFQKAKDFIDLGPERSMILSVEDKKRTAYHEAGHAIVALATPNSHPVQHATIVPHGNALGLVLSYPEKDIVFQSKAMIQARIDMALGGFVAEEIIFGPENISLGPSSDLRMANAMASQLVIAGFGKRTGLFQKDDPTASDEAKLGFENDVREILAEAMDRVRKLLKEQTVAWHSIAEALILKETLNKQELEEIFAQSSRNKLKSKTSSSKK